ncbi:MAG: sulfopyruvate decarboxylase subunit alpha [Nitrospiraceae bacterium]|nr:sulfopyruvate decarboxylase subunit alpha [Nitrospiraceae bacterium]
MRNPEERLLTILRGAGVDFTSSLPCEKIKVLLEMVGGRFFHVPLTREEEGVGICAGAALAGKRPAMFVQSSGIGNMLNALLSLTQFYELPLAIFVSQRGIYQEKIAAQFPMGRRLPTILRGAGIEFSLIGGEEDFGTVEKKLSATYRKNKIHAFLMSPVIWEGSGAAGKYTGCGSLPLCGYQAGTAKSQPETAARPAGVRPAYARYEILKIAAPYLEGKAVVCNLGVPSKELYHIGHRPSHFYMLGSMGMATPIGLGVSLASGKEVVVIDGDGSLLMNPGTLATAAHFAPANLTILAVDNTAYGSTGSQPTLAGSCVDLEAVARGFGIRNTLKAATKKQLITAMERTQQGLRFIHALARPGNRNVPNIPLGHLDVKRAFADYLASETQ